MSAETCSPRWAGSPPQHDDVLLTALDHTERQQLHTMLSRVAAQQGLTTGVHPGYRTLATPEKDEDK